MIAALFLSVLLQASSTPTLSVDLDGDGVAESVSAVPHGKRVRIEVKDSDGRRRARAEAPSPGSGVPQIALLSGSIGSAGALFEVSAVTAAQECRTVWRLRGKELSSVSIVGPKGRLPDCATPEGWKVEWKKLREDGPADYVRDRTRVVVQGEHHRTEVYQFSGFELVLDSARSEAKIDGVPIPDWSPLVLYPRPLIETLLSCFDLSPFKTTTRLRILTDRAEGIFALEVVRPSGSRRLPVRQAQEDPEHTEWLLTAFDGERSGQIRLRLAADRRHPLELLVEGLEEDLRRSFVPVSRWRPQGIEIFQSAEDELALQSLVGDWDSRRGERISITVVSLNPAVVDFGKQRVTLDIVRAPEGSDVILLPRDGSPPRTAFQLRGPNTLTRLPITCQPAGTAAWDGCRVSEPGESFRRVGSQLNTR